MLCLLAQSTYYGPEDPYYGPSPAPFQQPSQDVRVEVQVYDEGTLGGVQVGKVIFNKQEIALRPAAIHSSRGGGSFLVKPGTYNLSWMTETQTSAWPRTQSYKRQVEVKKGDYWIQITIRGSQCEID